MRDREFKIELYGLDECPRWVRFIMTEAMVKAAIEEKNESAIQAAQFFVWQAVISLFQKEIP